MESTKRGQTTTKEASHPVPPDHREAFQSLPKFSLEEMRDMHLRQNTGNVRSGYGDCAPRFPHLRPPLALTASTVDPRSPPSSPTLGAVLTAPTPASATAKPGSAGVGARAARGPGPGALGMLSRAGRAPGASGLVLHHIHRLPRGAAGRSQARRALPAGSAAAHPRRCAPSRRLAAAGSHGRARPPCCLRPGHPRRGAGAPRVPQPARSEARQGRHGGFRPRGAAARALRGRAGQ